MNPPSPVESELRAHYALARDNRSLSALLFHLLADGRSDEALSLLNPEPEFLYGDSRLLGLAAKAAFASADYARAEGWHRAQLGLDPNAVQAYVGAALSLIQQGQFEPARALLEVGLKADGGAPAIHLVLAQICELRGNWRQALRHAQQAAARHPTARAVRLTMARALTRLGQHDFALAAIDALLADRQHGAAIDALRADVLVDAGRLDDAEAASAGLEGAAATRLRGRLALARGDIDTALAAFEHALADDPSRADVHRDFGHALLRVGVVDAGLTAIERALALTPEDSALHHLYADALLTHRGGDAALPAYQHALALDPALASARRALWAHYAESGQWARIAADISQLPTASRDPELLLLAATACVERDPAGAEALLARAGKAWPESLRTPLLRVYGRIAQGRGDFSQALTDYAAACTIEDRGAGHGPQALSPTLPSRAGSGGPLLICGLAGSAIEHVLRAVLELAPTAVLVDRYDPQPLRADALTALFAGEAATADDAARAQWQAERVRIGVGPETAEWLPLRVDVLALALALTDSPRVVVVEASAQRCFMQLLTRGSEIEARAPSLQAMAEQLVMQWQLVDQLERIDGLSVTRINMDQLVGGDPQVWATLAPGIDSNAAAAQLAAVLARAPWPALVEPGEVATLWPLVPPAVRALVEQLG